MLISSDILKERQSLPLHHKETMSLERVEEWYRHWKSKVYVSFSGGKDSTVLLHLVRRLYPEVPGVFVDTGLEYPEIREFVKTIDNIVWLKPKMSFKKVIKTHGYPVVSKDVALKIYEVRNTLSAKLMNKRWFGDGTGNGKLPKKWRFLISAPFDISDKCCYHLKKSPLISYEKSTNSKPIVGTMTYDSANRLSSYLRKGCNAFETKRPMSTPLAFWLESDVWDYIRKYQLGYSSIYKKGYDRTGCMFCMFGVHLEKGTNRFQRMKETHPKQYEYCINKLGCGQVLDYIGVAY